MSDETTELREGLTERGIEWKSEPDDYGEQTIWQTPSGTWCYYSDNFSRIAEPSLTIHGIMPEQAVAATLGKPEIVRCRDCKFCMAYMAGTYCDYMAHSVEPDGFCAWAERKAVKR